MLKDKKDGVKKLFEENSYWKAFLEINPTYLCDKQLEANPLSGGTGSCVDQRRRLQLGLLGGVDNIQETAEANDEVTSDEAKAVAVNATQE